MNNSKQCYKCGNQYNQNHFQSCRAEHKICSKCAKRGHFAKICGSKNVNYLGNRQDEQEEKIETGSLENENDPVAFAEFKSNNGLDEYQIDKFWVIAIAESFEIKNTIILTEEDLNGHIVKLKTNSGELIAIADSGSPMSFINKKKPHGVYNKTINQHYSNASNRTTLPEIWHATMVKQYTRKED